MRSGWWKANRQRNGVEDRVRRISPDRADILIVSPRDEYITTRSVVALSNSGRARMAGPVPPGTDHPNADRTTNHLNSP